MPGVKNEISDIILSKAINKERKSSQDGMELYCRMEKINVPYFSHRMEHYAEKEKKKVLINRNPLKALNIMACLGIIIGLVYFIESAI
ncbi:hypothetical protein [Clostridium sp. ZS2-4]|uniref:hypothetical protein n=1 Tax=Clostridium sp. ZS2-4 TaxID=2987703 RepID=UPI00227B073D|nr:hypothetical protein [Clostridium sp. ZS2-4]MCY6356071.1 hypothetical protein [Clostridium sp. ZS2-4]